MFWENFIKLCAEKGKTPTSVVLDLGYSKGTVTHWKNGHVPQVLALHKIADYFGVTVEYLLGKETEKPQKEKAPTEEALKVALFGGADVPDELWDKVTEYAKFLVEQDKRNRK
jgi:transcriptional regulator with XRE-family HTH domain